MAQPISASSPAPTSTTATPPPSSASQKSFSLAPAIFTPFKSLSPDPFPADPIARLESILTNLNKQHDAVRRNMFSLLEQRARDLVSTAKKELARLEREAREGEDWVGELEEIGEGEVRGLMRRIRGMGRQGQVYDVKREDFRLWGEEITQRFQGGDGNGNVEMSGTGTSPNPPQSQPLTATQIRKQLTHDLRDLVDRGVYEIGLYDVHAAETCNFYRDALERKRGKPPRIVTGALPPGILRNREESGEVRRMSTGMPVAASAVERQPLRFFENFENVARRGSK